MISGLPYTLSGYVHLEPALSLGVKSIEHCQFITEKTVRLLKEEGAFLQRNLVGMSRVLFEHPVYSGNPAVAQNGT